MGIGRNSATHSPCTRADLAHRPQTGLTPSPASRDQVSVNPRASGTPSGGSGRRAGRVDAHLTRLLLQVWQACASAMTITNISLVSSLRPTNVCLGRTFPLSSEGACPGPTLLSGCPEAIASEKR